MRTISRLLRTSWLVLLGVVFALPLPPITNRVGAWQGATIDWSPTATTEAVGGPAAWDVEGWLDDGQREVHALLDQIEMSLWLGLVEVREEAYEWRDQLAPA